MAALHGLLTALACLCLFSGCAGAGALLAGLLRRRPEELGRLESALAQLETEIAYLGTPLPEALARVAATVAGPARQLLQAAAAGLGAGEGVTAAEAWRAAVAVADARSAWTATDRHVLLDLAPALGASGREEQLRHLARCRERLGELRAEARAAAERMARAWAYLGALGGLGLVVLCL